MPYRAALTKSFLRELRKLKLKDEYVRREIEEAIERVVEFG